MHVMRLAAFILLALALSAAVASGAARRAEWRFASRSRAAGERCRSPARACSSAGSGRARSRSSTSTPNDQWSPRVNGIPRGKTVTLRGKNVSFYIPGGRYKIIARGSDISISARGTGAVILTEIPTRSATPACTRSVTDDLVPLPEVQTKATFGPSEVTSAVSSIGQDPTMTTPQTILVVEDETSIASFVALYLKNAGYVVKAVGTGGAALNAIAAEHARADHPRPQPARHGRPRDLPPRAQELRRPDPDADRARRGRRQDHRPRGRRRRLPDEALQPA